MLDLQFIMMTTASGERDTERYKAVIPDLKLCVDYQHDAMVNFLNSMNYTHLPAVHLEDDIVLCDNFVERVTAACNEWPDHIINFFSLRSEDYEILKPHLVPGRRFMMNQCFYIPAGVGPEIAKFYETWPRKQEHPTGYDILMADWMKEHKLKYVQWFPHLVNHEHRVSLINPKWSSGRGDKRWRKSADYSDIIK